MLCEYCNKPLRKCKRVDFTDRKIHFNCIKKIQKKRYEEAFNKLRELLKSNDIFLIH